MKAYPAYKSSGVEWLEEIPEKWEFRPIKRIFSEVDIKKGNASYPLLSFSREKGLIIPPIDKKGVPDDLSCYKVLKKGQLLENRMQAWSGMFICADKDGCVSPDYSVFEAIDINTTSVKFYEYVFRNHIWVSLFANASKGIGTGFNRLYTPQFGAIKTIVPPVEEQNAIVAYLDKKCAEIDELVSRRQAIIERLKELKQSIIAEAVTKGLHPNVSMKDSGIAWLGEVPQHWNIERLQWHLREIKEINSPIKTNRVLSLTNKKGVIPYEEKGNQGNKAKASHDEYKLAYPDTLVMNSMNVIIGSVGICNYFGCVSPVYYIFKTAGETMLSFVNYVFQTTRFQKELRRHAKGILEIRLRLSSGDILKRLVAFPPLHEQQSIVAYLDKKCAEIDELVARQEQIIEKLKELKISTIAHVVTGKVDVRDAI